MEVYIDDMLVKSFRTEDHLTHLIEVFDVLHMYGMKLNPNKNAFKVSLGKFLGFMVNQWGIEAQTNKISIMLEMEASQLVREVQWLTTKIVILNRFLSKVIDTLFQDFEESFYV